MAADVEAERIVFAKEQADDLCANDSGLSRSARWHLALRVGSA
jgi:hypothetical protein